MTRPRPPSSQSPVRRGDIIRLARIVGPIQASNDLRALGF